MFKAVDQILKISRNYPHEAIYFAKGATSEHDCTRRRRRKKGKADVLIRTNESAMITDLKTTAKVRQVFQNRAVNALRFAVSSLHAGDSIA